MAAFAAIGAFLAQNAAAISAVTTLAATGITAMGQSQAAEAQADAAEQQGRYAQQQANFEAKQLKAKALEEHAAAQQEASQYRRKKELALSKLQADAAGSNWSATDASTLALAGEIARYGTVQEQMAMYGGASRRAGYETQAKVTRFNGASEASARFAEADATRSGAKYQVAGTILGGATSLLDRFGDRARPKQSSAYRYG
jgi:hypothetical protein